MCSFGKTTKHNVKKNLLILVCLATLLSCTNKGENCKKESNNEIECTESKLSPESEQAGNIPSANNAMTHIFHGWTESIAKAHLNEEGDVTGWSKWEPLVVKYALYLDEGIIAIYDDSTQLHQIEEYLGKEIRSDEGAVSYNIMVNDYGDFGGYIKFYYQDDGMVQLYVDYPEMMISYSLESFMPEEELERRLGKYSTQK